MQPVEVADYLDTDISAGLNRKQIKQRTVKYGVNIIQNEIKLSFPQSIKNQLKGLITPLLIICSLLMFIFDRQYAYLAVSGVSC
jgi:magnesium-transporting ATPase (P-type)